MTHNTPIFHTPSQKNITIFQTVYSIPGITLSFFAIALPLEDFSIPKHPQEVKHRD